MEEKLKKKTLSGKDLHKKNLPFLSKERLDIIFDHVYDIANIGEESSKIFDDEKLGQFLSTLKSMQMFNYCQRHDDTRYLFYLCNPIFNFERNSDGTTLWLSLILAIKELYGFSEKKLITVLKQVSVRK